MKREIQKKTEQLNFRASPEIRRGLRVVAAAEDLPMQDLICTILRYYFGDADEVEEKRRSRAISTTKAVFGSNCFDTRKDAAHHSPPTTTHEPMHPMQPTLMPTLAGNPGTSGFFESLKSLFVGRPELGVAA
jgi:hypothetical protein